MENLRKRPILRYNERGDEWTLQSGFDGAVLLGRPGIELVAVEPAAIPPLDPRPNPQMEIKEHGCYLLIEKHALVLEKSAELKSHQNEIERLKRSNCLSPNCSGCNFGPSSEKVARHIDQLGAPARGDGNGPHHSCLSSSPKCRWGITARKPLRADLPCEVETLAPKEKGSIIRSDTGTLYRG